MPTLLLAEDEADIRLVARLALKRAGFDVITVQNGEEAIAAALAHQPDVIILDWMMPGLDGPSACARLKADPATRDIPVIFVTAKSQQSEIARGLSLGALGYIVKPFDALLLGERVRQLLAAVS